MQNFDYVTHFFERDYDEKYDFVAPFSVIYKFSFNEIFSEPFFDYETQLNKYSTHANSVINITILDTFVIISINFLIITVIIFQKIEKTCLQQKVKV